ncbi:hypothetical protein BKA56DRAFT_623055 [Ilyonectria sp. MPI-CAGE-AT-0026]|nr:hypothetical protein BKA56DRAFT_623055 [Ilyonectria sp. MPI-CAGE-AT-0026]
MNVNALRRVFVSRFKLPVHIVELIVSLVVLILGVVRLVMRNRNAPRTRSGSMALGMAGKSMVIILYQVLSQHTQYFRKWMSFKANLILNSLEIVFWGAVAFLTMQANTQSCQGVTCALGWVIVVLAIIMCKLSFYEAGVSYFEYKDYKTGTKEVVEGQSASSSGGMEMENGTTMKAGGV